MFVDWCFLTAFGYEKALALLCQPEKSAGAGCTYSLRYYKAKGQFHTSGPQPGDQIFFGKSLDNATHTGIVESVDSKQVHTIEGNTSDQVARRNYSLTNSRILGYGRPGYDGAPVEAPQPVEQPTERPATKSAAKPKAAKPKASPSAKPAKAASKTAKPRKSATGTAKKKAKRV